MRRSRKLSKDILNIYIKQFKNFIYEWNKVRFETDKDQKSIYNATNVSNRKGLYIKLGIIREQIERILEVRLDDKYLLITLLMYDGYFVDFDEGELKSYSIMMVALLKAYEGQVHIAMINKYLAKKECEKFKKIYDFFDCKVDYITEDKKLFDGSMASNNVIYMSASKIVQDYLECRENDTYNDFLDLHKNLIISNLKFPLILYANRRKILQENIIINDKERIYILAQKIYNVLRKYKIHKYSEVDGDIKKNIDYTFDIKKKEIIFTISGKNKVEELFEIKRIDSNNEEVWKILNAVIEANLFYFKDKNYLIRADEVNLVNINNIDEDKQRRLEMAIKVKERDDSRLRDFTSKSISYQIALFKYHFITGIGNDLDIYRNEIVEMYDKIVIKLDTKKKKDIKTIITKTYNQKFDEVIKLFNTYDKVVTNKIVYTDSEITAMRIHEKFDKCGIKSKVLCSQNNEKNVYYIKKALMNDEVIILVKDYVTEVDMVANKTYNSKILIISFETNKIGYPFSNIIAEDNTIITDVILYRLSSLEDIVFKNENNKIINKYLSYGSGKFYNIDIQDELNIKLQENIYSNNRKQRKKRIYEFHFEVIIDKIRHEYLSEYDKIDLINVINKKKMRVYKQKVLNKINDFENITEAKNVFKEIYKIVNSEGWNGLAKKLYYMKKDVFLYEYSEDLIIDRFSYFCNLLYLKTIKIILEDAINEFLEFDLED